MILWTQPFQWKGLQLQAFHAVRPAKEPQEILPALPTETPKLGKTDGIGVDAPESLNSPPQIRTPPRR
jgi:hypothetical protein